MYSTEQAELLAIQALGYLAAAPEGLEQLMGATGMDKEGLMRCADSVENLVGILDYICQDESLLLGFCDSAGLRPDEPAKALRALQKHPDTGAA